MVRRRKRAKELIKQKNLAEEEGIEMENSEELSSSDPNNSSKGDTDDLAATKAKGNKKKSTKEKRKEALGKKAKEEQVSKNDPTVVADFSRDGSESENDGSRREMIIQNDTVRPGDEKRGPVGSSRFDADDGGAADLPDGDEEGGGFF